MIDSTTNVSGASSRWSEGLEEESAFWLRWLSSGGDPWKEDFVRRTTADFELQWHIQRYLPSADDAELEILDVGSGPLTVLGKRWGNRRLHITAVDPLADMYDRHLAATGITPIVRTIRGRKSGRKRGQANNTW